MVKKSRFDNLYKKTITDSSSSCSELSALSDSYYDSSDTSFASSNKSSDISSESCKTGKRVIAPVHDFINSRSFFNPEALDSASPFSKKDKILSFIEKEFF